MQFCAHIWHRADVLRTENGKHIIAVVDIVVADANIVCDRASEQHKFRLACVLCASSLCLDDEPACALHSAASGSGNE